MKKTLTLVLLCATLLTAACSNPMAPTAIDPMQLWASAHAHEVCILASRYDATYIDYGVLVPLGQQPGSATIMPISFCNPAE